MIATIVLHMAGGLKETGMQLFVSWKFLLVRCILYMSLQFIKTILLTRLVDRSHLVQNITYSTSFYKMAIDGLIFVHVYYQNVKRLLMGSNFMVYYEKLEEIS